MLLTQMNFGGIWTDDYEVNSFYLNGVEYSTANVYTAFDYSRYGMTETTTVGAVRCKIKTISRHYIKTGDLFTVKRSHSTDTTSFTYVYLHVAKILHTDGSQSS